MLPLPRPVPHDVPQVGVANVEELHDDERQYAQRPSDIYAAHKEGTHHSNAAPIATVVIRLGPCRCRVVTRSLT